MGVISPPGGSSSSSSVLNSREPLTFKTRSKLAIPNTWTNTARQAFPENVCWDSSLGLYVGVYMANDGANNITCYFTASSIDNLRNGVWVDGGAVRGIPTRRAQTPHLMCDGSIWYIFGQSASGAGIELWSCSTSPAGAGTFTLAQASLFSLGAIAQISAPSAPTVTPTTGAPGTLPAGTYNYRISAMTAAGETNVGSYVASGTLASTGYFTVRWSAVSGETNGYNVYRFNTTTSTYQLISTVATGVLTYQDNGASPVSPVVEPPLSNLSSSFDIGGALEEYCIRIPATDPLYRQGYRFALFYMGENSTGGSSQEQVGVAVSTTINAASWTKLNSGNPILPCGGGYAIDADGSADPFVWITETGRIVLFYVGIEYGGAQASSRWQYCAAYANTVAGPFTKLGRVIDSPTYYNVGKGGQASWTATTYPFLTGSKGDEVGPWRGSFIRNDRDNEVIWIYAGRQLRGSATNVSVRGYVATIDMNSPLLIGFAAGNNWERLEAENFNEPRWSSTGTWTNQTSALEYSNSAISFATAVGATKTFSFEGVAVKLGLTTAGNCGIVDIYIDGVYDATLDLYSPDPGSHCPVLYYKAGLLPGYHTVQLVIVGKNSSSSNTVIALDYAERLASGVGT